MSLAVRVAILDVGQADTIVVHTTGSQAVREAVVVDCVNQERVFNYLRQEGVTRVFAVVITHFHADHYRQVMAFYRAYGRWFPGQTPPRLIVRMLPGERSVEHILRGDEREVKTFAKFQKWLNKDLERPVLVETATPGSAVFDTGSWTGVLSILHPGERHILPLLAGGDYNNLSVVLKVQGRASSVLLTADVQPDGWQAMCTELESRGEDLAILRATFLKGPHHGGWRETSSQAADFSTVLEKVGPTATILSVGARQPGDYGHPEDHVLATLAKHQVRAICTQATEKCCQNNSLAWRPVVQFPLPPGPCAGDVILDLDRDGFDAMLGPTASQHETRVLAGFPSHRCYLMSGTATVQNTLFPDDME